MPRETRVYPTPCTSAYCGRIHCEGCRYLPALEEFKTWVKKTDAKVADKIWCPLVYTGTLP